MRIHVTGASGSGTSTLGAALASALKGRHFEADDYYWLPTSPPFTEKRAAPERLSLLTNHLNAAETPVLAGSIVGWGPQLEDSFDFIVFLYLDAAVRVERLRQREIARYGYANPEFLEWAAQYDVGPSEGRSLAKHRAWLEARTCPIIEIPGDLSVSERMAALVRAAPDLSFDKVLPHGRDD